MSINIDYLALKKDVKVPSSFVIAPQDAINKSGADLILTGDPEADRAAIQQAIHDLHNARESTDIAIRIDFLGGTINVGEKTDGNAIVIPAGYDNIYIYGNGVKINGNIGYESLFSVVDCWLFDLEVKNSAGGGIYATNSTLTNCSSSGGDYGHGIHATNSTLTNCSSSGGDYGHGIYTYNSTLTNCSGSGVDGIYAYNSTLTNCSGSGGDYGHGHGIYTYNSTLTNCSGSGENDYGIYAYNSTLTNCSGSSENDYGIYAYSSCIIQGCDGTEGGISVPSTGTYPQTLELLQALNKGTITIRS